MCQYKLVLPYGEDITKLIEHPALYKHKDLLKEFVDNRIFCIYYSDRHKEFRMEECCDNYFSCELTKEQCLELSEMFKDMADYLA